MPALPAKVYTAAQVREIDQRAIQDYAIAGYTLMQRAGTAAFELLQTKLALIKANSTKPIRILVACGGGNNAGDGYVIARLAKSAGLHVDLLALVPTADLQADARLAAQDWQQVAGQLVQLDSLQVSDYAIIVDSILGTGLQRQVAGSYKQAIKLINTATCPVLAIDIPSGLHADTGQPLGVAVKADDTITFIALKRGLLTAQAGDYCGEIHYADLDLPAAVFNQTKSLVRRIQAEDVHNALPKRARSAHKGNFGHVLIIGGEAGMSGAVLMAGMAALRTGAGLVSLATRSVHAYSLNNHQPELMCHAVDDIEQLLPLLSRASVVAIGPGLGQSDWAKALLSCVLESTLPLVLDADALNLLAAEPVVRSNCILTPHPGEAARLLATETAAIQADRFQSVNRLAQTYQATVVLKGLGTLVASSNEPVTNICDLGNPGMASGGMGDVLTGIIVSLLAQGLGLHMAASIGVYLHAQAADQAAEQGERGLLATDLLAFLRG